MIEKYSTFKNLWRTMHALIFTILFKISKYIFTTALITYNSLSILWKITTVWQKKTARCFAHTIPDINLEIHFQPMHYTHIVFFLISNPFIVYWLRKTVLESLYFRKIFILQAKQNKANFRLIMQYHRLPIRFACNMYVILASIRLVLESYHF